MRKSKEVETAIRTNSLDPSHVAQLPHDAAGRVQHWTRPLQGGLEVAVRGPARPGTRIRSWRGDPKAGGSSGRRSRGSHRLYRRGWRCPRGHLIGVDAICELSIAARRKLIKGAAESAALLMTLLSVVLRNGESRGVELKEFVQRETCQPLQGGLQEGVEQLRELLVGAQLGLITKQNVVPEERVRVGDRRREPMLWGARVNECVCGATKNQERSEQNEHTKNTHSMYTWMSSSTWTHLDFVTSDQEKETHGLTDRICQLWAAGQLGELVLQSPAETQLLFHDRQNTPQPQGHSWVRLGMSETIGCGLDRTDSEHEGHLTTTRWPAPGFKMSISKQGKTFVIHHLT